MASNYTMALPAVFLWVLNIPKDRVRHTVALRLGTVPEVQVANSAELE